MVSLRRLPNLLKPLFYITSAYFILPYFLKITTGIYENFYTSSISFDLDTLYVDWNTAFPAVTICEIYNGEKIWNIAHDIFSTSEDGEHNLHLDDFVGEVVFYRGICTTCEKCLEDNVAETNGTSAVENGDDVEGDNTDDGPDAEENEYYGNSTETSSYSYGDEDGDGEMFKCPKNFTELALLFRSSCHQLLKNCSYLNQKYDCCDVFQPIHTEYGVCFSFNSKQAKRISQVEYANNRVTGAGNLKFDTTADVQMHIHPPIEIPYFYSEGIIRETVLLGSHKEIILNVMEVYNHVSVTRLSMWERRCRFAEELTEWGSELGIYAFYSHSTCVVECTLALQLQICECGSHFLANYARGTAYVPTCDNAGLSCLSAHHYDLQEARKTCDCMSSCEEPEYDIIFNSADDLIDKAANGSSIRVALVELPTQRYVRRVTRDFLDLLISVGGIVGLFFNMSFIRLVEFLYLLREFRFRRVWRRLRC